MNINEMLTQLKKRIPEKNFRTQPDFSREEIIKFEKKYNNNTKILLTNPNLISNLTCEDKEDWYHAFKLFERFEGSIYDINTIETKVINAEFIHLKDSTELLSENKFINEKENSLTEFSYLL